METRKVRDLDKQHSLSVRQPPTRYDKHLGRSRRIPVALAVDCASFLGEGGGIKRPQARPYVADAVSGDRQSVSIKSFCCGGRLRWFSISESWKACSVHQRKSWADKIWRTLKRQDFPKFDGKPGKIPSIDNVKDAGWRTVLLPRAKAMSIADISGEDSFLICLLGRGATRVNTIPNKTNASSADSDRWVERLRSEEADVRDAALAELRSILLRGLSSPMQQRYRGALQPEDVVQEALMKILDSLDKFEGRSKFTTWAMTLAIRVGISEMRRKHYQDVSLESFQSADATRVDIAIDESIEVERQLDQKAMVEKLQQVIDTELTEKQRAAIRASLDGMPVEVIAEKFGSNRNSVYKLVHDARLKLRQGLENAGIAADDFAAVFA